MFDGKKSVKVSDLKNKFYKDLTDIKDKIYKSTVEKKYFNKHPNRVRATYATIGIISGICGFFLGSTLGIIFMWSIVISAGIVLIFGVFMPKKTKKGVLIKEKIYGLKMYMNVAEKDRIKFHNAPTKNPELFEKLLPYAMVMKVEKEWAEQFKDLYKSQPDWYSDPSGGAFNAAFLASSLGDFSSSSQKSLSSKPGSAAGGSSGFSGGGFSGGGVACRSYVACGPGRFQVGRRQKPP